MTELPAGADDPVQRVLPVLPGNRLRTPLSAQFEAFQGDWAPLLHSFASSPAGQALCAAVDARVAAGAAVYPGQVLRAFALTPRSRVRVLILGQDPYHGPGQAEGLAFSVADAQRWPPSLRNILMEWHRDLALPLPVSGSLQAWAGQGVLLLNSCLTVEDGAPGSHTRFGWQALTQQIVYEISASPAPTVFMLWGSHAQALGQAARQGSQHLVLCCNHPSPLSARRPPVPFVGCGHFSRASRFLAEQGRGVLDWALG